MFLLHAAHVAHAHAHAVTVTVTVAVRIHASIAIPTNGEVLDETETQGAPAILVSGEFCNGRLGVVGRVELHDTGATRATVWLVLDFGTVDFANGLEKLDKVFVAGRPGELDDWLA